MENLMGTIKSYLAAQTDIQRSIILKLSSFNSLEDLVGSLDLDEKIELAKNPKTNEDILEILSNVPNIYVIAAVALNLKTNEETFKIIDPNIYVRAAVAEHPKTSKKTLNELSNDSNEDVKKVAIESLNKRQ